MRSVLFPVVSVFSLPLLLFLLTDQVTTATSLRARGRDVFHCVPCRDVFRCVPCWFCFFCFC